MVPCFICGHDAEGGWIQGFPPAPDSQKLGLCALHDNETNRRNVTRNWQSYLQTVISSYTHNAICKIKPARLLSLFFVGGGSISVPCTNISTPDNDLLKVETPSNETIFFQLRQVRHYSLGPLPPAASTTASTPAVPLSSGEHRQASSPLPEVKTEAQKPEQSHPASHDNSPKILTSGLRPFSGATRIALPAGTTGDGNYAADDKKAESSDSRLSEKTK